MENDLIGSFFDEISKIEVPNFQVQESTASLILENVEYVSKKPRLGVDSIVHEKEIPTTTLVEPAKFVDTFAVPVPSSEEIKNDDLNSTSGVVAAQTSAVYTGSSTSTSISVRFRLLSSLCI